MTFEAEIQELRFLENLTVLSVMARVGTSAMRYEHLIKQREVGGVPDVA